MGKIAFKESFNKTISLGEALPVATLEINLSKSDIFVLIDMLRSAKNHQNL